ncbi:F0F1 ATP synthase subunit epsilon [Quadrisphaera sp. GCM10027208]|uniref:F0F1 ATP synthase subunit epsilon n=1 Tax=Quadrisphaera sp. GCM10027208 TaxID=3273423 RepID=UPI003605F3E9
MAELHVELVAADRTVWSGEASLVVARTTEGELGVMPGHTPVLGALVQGEVRVHPVSGSPVTVTTGGGFLSVEHDRVVLVLDDVTMPDETTASR